jgi:hypothetical protein
LLKAGSTEFSERNWNGWGIRLEPRESAPPLESAQAHSQNTMRRIGVKTFRTMGLVFGSGIVAAGHEPRVHCTQTGTTWHPAGDLDCDGLGIVERTHPALTSPTPDEYVIDVSAGSAELLSLLHLIRLVIGKLRLLVRCFFG